MSKYRKIFFQILLVPIFAVIVHHSWSANKKQISTPADGENRAPTKVERMTISLHEKVFFLQSKILVGAVAFLEQYREYLGEDGGSHEEVKNSIHQSFEQVVAEFSESDEATSVAFGSRDISLGDEELARILRRQLIVARYLGLQETSAQLEERIRGLSKEEEAVSVANELLFAEEPFSDEEIQAAKERYGWFAELLIFEKESDEAKKAELKAVISASASKAFEKFLLFLFGAFLVGLLSVTLFVVFCYKLSTKTLKFHFERSEALSQYGLEIFVLYLIGMMLAPKFIEFLTSRGIGLNVLRANAIGISSLVILIFWPCFFGVSFQALTRGVGLFLGGLQRVVRNVLLGPTAYITALIPMISVLFIYSLVMMVLGIDPSSGTHPIVPIITGTKDSQTRILVFLLAVVIAPIVEEIMFRGAFYGWLRGRFGVFASIFLSAFIFAAVHPQGFVGMVPLTFIGMVLAFLREWRGSLITPMLAHASFNGGTLLLVKLIFG